MMIPLIFGRRGISKVGRKAVKNKPLPVQLDQQQSQAGASIHKPPDISHNASHRVSPGEGGSSQLVRTLKTDLLGQFMSINQSISFPSCHPLSCLPACLPAYTYTIRLQSLHIGQTTKSTYRQPNQTKPNQIGAETEREIPRSVPYFPLTPSLMPYPSTPESSQASKGCVIAMNRDRPYRMC